MIDEPFDRLLDVMPYEDMTDGMLQRMEFEGDEKAGEELQRRSERRVLGPSVADASPVAERSDEVLVKQMALGDEAAEAEFDRRNNLDAPASS